MKWLPLGTHVIANGVKGTLIERLPGLAIVAHVTIQEGYPYTGHYDPALVVEDGNPAQ